MTPAARLVASCLALVAAASCHAGPGAADAGVDAGPVFIAEDSDFAGFTGWTSFQLPTSDPFSDVFYPAGTRVAFLSQRPPAGATRYPVGTRIVKVVEVGAGPMDWEIYAMAKRGGGFNSAGAVDWEFFLLRLVADASADAGTMTPHIVSRGIAPDSDGRAPDAGLSPATPTGYLDNGVIAPCNVCHGQSNLIPEDYMLGTQLPPSVTAIGG